MANRFAAPLVFFCALSVLVPAAATRSGVGTEQDPPPQTPPPQQPTPTFRARVDSVSVDVMVSDRQGRPVTDLTIDDFEIRESSKVQKIDTFKFVEILEGTPGPTTSRDITSMADQDRETSRTDNRLLVIFLDDYHVRRINSMRVREQLASFVSQLTPHDLVAITYPLLSVSGITFSYNHDGTAAAVMHFEGRKYDYNPRNQMEERYQMLSPEAQEQMRNGITIRALESVCAYLGSLRDGRKTVLYVSEGMSGSLPAGVRTTGTLGPVGRSMGTPAQVDQFATFDLLSQLREIFVVAGRTNTSIYTLDPRGLTGSEFDISDSVNSDNDKRVLNESTDLLRTVANNTDGRAIVSRNDPRQGLQQMLRDQSAYYLLGYTSSVAARDGKFHEIQVRVKRKDIDVRARKGYWAWTAEDVEKASAPPKPQPPREIVEALDRLVVAAEPTRRRSFRTWLGAARGAGDKNVVTFAWEAVATSPGTTPDPADVVDRVSILVNSIYGDVLYRGPVPRDETAARPAGRVAFEAPAGAVTVRVTAENARGGRLDADEASLDVPDFGAAGLTFGTPVVFRGRTARDIQQVRTAATPPMPAVERVFSRTERLFLRIQVFESSGAAPALTMRLLNQRGDQLAPLPAPVRTADGQYEAEIGLGSLPPSDYLIEIAASAGDQKKRLLLAIKVTG